MQGSLLRSACALGWQAVFLLPGEIQSLPVAGKEAWRQAPSDDGIIRPISAVRCHVELQYVQVYGKA